MAKTAYQQKRQFLNKINKRIKTLTERAGVNKADIEDLIKVNGTWFTETGNLNMTTEAYLANKEGIEHEIMSAVPSYLELREKVRADIRFMATTGHYDADESMERLHAEMKQHFSFRNQFEEYLSQYYDIEESLMGQRNLTQEDLRKIDLSDLTFEDQKLILEEIPKRLKQLGRDWRAGLSPSELFQQLVEIKGKKPKVWGKK